ncbi:MAG: arylsulfatase [Acidimicrobiia bacterium]|nr:arylsulfatase [Acidimicrobiia bacterium]
MKGASEVAEITEYPEGEAFPGVVGRTLDESSPAWPVPPHAPEGAPNVVLFVLDDVGYGQSSAFGGLCEMPTLDRLAARGLRYRSYHTTALCSPTRGCLLTGRNHHTLGLASITELSLGFPSHNAHMGFEHGLVSEMLVAAGYNTFAVGKWHLTPSQESTSAGPFHRWPLGRGFERFYGFMPGDTDQWFPSLVQDNGPVEPPYTPEEGYHLNRDLADHAIQFVKDAHVGAPDKPFFLYYATGAGHAPHHVEPEWVEPYRGRFDAGWDAYREEVFRRQVEQGLVPSDTTLSERDPDVPAWDSLTDDQKRMYARQMEVYAGFLTQTDHHFGRVLDFIEEIGELDNTIVVVVSDNGASAEGRVHGSVNEAFIFNNVPDTFEQNLDHYEDWGGVDTFPHYAWGWAWAGNVPFRRWKRETYRGGISDLCIVTWPRGIPAGGGVRGQYLHSIDMAPTLLDVIGVERPETIRGVAQSEIHGVSFADSFTDADAESRHKTQDFEMFGHRSIYHEGWKAVCPWIGPSFVEAGQKGRLFGLTELTGQVLDELDADGWELYDLSRDPAETQDLAAAEPERLEAMIQRWYTEADKYGVLPLAGVGVARIGERPMPGRRDRMVFYPGAAPLPFSTAPRLVNRPFTVTADVVLADAATEGVVFSQGGRHGGFALYMYEGRLCHVYNYLGVDRFTVESATPIPAGEHRLAYEFEPVGHANLLVGKGVPARVRLACDGELLVTGELPHSVPILLGLGGGMSCGYDTTDSVDPSRWQAPFAFTGEIRRVTLDMSGDATVDFEAEVTRILTQQ